MPDQSVGLEASTLWLALVVGLLVQGFVIYAGVRFALFHDRLMVTRQEAAAAAKVKHQAGADAWRTAFKAEALVAEAEAKAGL